MLNTIETGQNVAKHPDVQANLHTQKPNSQDIEPRRTKHTARKIIAGTIAAASIVAYANFHDEIDDYVSEFINANFPAVTQAIEPTESITPVDNLIIPEDLAIEDNQLRQSVKIMIQEGNRFNLDINEVRQYLLDGEIDNFNTFEVIKDAQNNPAFIIVKGGGNYGFDEKVLATIKRGIDKLNKIDSSMVRIMVDKYDLRFVASKIDFFERQPTWGGTYEDSCFGGVISLNAKLLNSYLKTETSNKQALYDDVDFITMSALIIESRAIYTTSKGTGSLTTIAPDRLDDNIGIDKGLYMLALSQKWFDEGRIDDTDKIRLDNAGRSAMSYYYHNK